jgi:hypothetical protein
MSALRAYLMTYNKDSGWDISVHRDLNTLVEKWENTQSTLSDSTALVHIGFNRPNTDHLKDLALQYSNKVLISESARWALPSEFSSAQESIGSFSIEGAAESQKIYMATSGWGYEIATEADNYQAASQNSIEYDLSVKPTGWIAELRDEEPSGLYQELAKQNVSDDVGYVEIRRDFPEKLRDELDLARYSFLRRSLDPKSMSKLLEIVPEFILRTDVKYLDLSVRILNVFQKNNIQKVGDVRHFGEAELLRQPNFGRTSLGLLVEAIEGLASGRPITDLTIEEDALRISLKNQVGNAIAAFPEKVQIVLRGRLGVGQEHFTLEYLGQQLGITRERVRQIEKKYISKIIEDYYWDDVIGQKLARLLNDRDEPLYLDLLCVEDEWFTGFDDNPTHLKYVIQYFTCNNPTSFYVPLIDGRYVVTQITESDWETLERMTRSTIYDRGMEQWSEEDMELVCGSMAQSSGVPDLKSLLFKSVREGMHVAKSPETNEVIIVGQGNLLVPLLRSVLLEATDPLHYSEIAKRCRAKTGNEYKERNIHAALPRAEAKLFGRGLFGLLKHLPVSEDTARNIVSDLEEVVVREGKERQWHCDELLDVLRKKDHTLAHGMDRYVIDILLEKSSRVQSLGRFVWSAGKENDLSAEHRIDIHQACISILEQANQPMTTIELRKELSRHRGVGKSFQIHPKDTLVKLDRGLWGLADWASNISKGQ